MNERIEKIKHAVEMVNDCKAKHVQSVPVHEAFQGQTVWQGVVEVFDLENHPKAKRAYAWKHGTAKGEDSFISVLEIPPVISPETAVRAAIVSRTKKK